MDDKYSFRMELNSKHFECVVYHIFYSYKSNRTEIISRLSAAQHMSENNAISAFDLVVSVLLRELRTVRLAYFTPPLTAAACSHLHFRQGYLRISNKPFLVTLQMFMIRVEAKLCRAAVLPYIDVCVSMNSYSHVIHFNLFEHYIYYLCLTVIL